MSRPEVFCKKRVLRNFAQTSQENTCARVSIFIKIEAPAQVFSCEFCEISKNTLSYRTLPVAASIYDHTVKASIKAILVTLLLILKIEDTTENNF